jgi:hypothetical protein
MAYKIDPATGEFQVDPSTGEFVEDSPAQDQSASLREAAKISAPSLGRQAATDASQAVLDAQTGKQVRDARIGGPEIVPGLLPRTTAIDNGGPGSRVAAYLADLATIPGRAAASIPGDKPLLEGMQDTKGTNFAGRVLRSPSTAAMAVAAPLTGGMSMIPALAATGAAGAAATQIDNKAEGKDFSLPQAIGETAMNTAGGYVLGKAGKAAYETVAPVVSRLASKAVTGALEKPAIQSLLGKLGYDINLAPKSIPGLAGEGMEANAPALIGGKLKEYDLLHPPEKANVNLQQGLQKYERAIGKVIENGDQAGATINTQAVLHNFADARTRLLAETGKGSTSYDALVNSALPKIQKAVDNLGDPTKVSFQKAVNFRRDLQDMVNNWGEGPDKNLIQGVAKELQSNMNDAIEASHPVYGPQLAKLNGKYSDLKAFEPMITTAAQKSLNQAATGTGGIEIPHTKYGIVGKMLNSPRVAAMDMAPKLADKIANLGTKEPAADALITDMQSRFAFPQNRYAAPIGPDKAPLKFGAPSAPRPADPLDAMAGPPNTSQSGTPGLEGMMPPEAIAARAQAEQETRDALVRQARPSRYALPRQEDPNLQIINPQDLPLSPRQPQGNIPANGFPKLQESPAIQDVLNKYAANRRPLVVNQEKIDALKALLKQDLPKAKKQEIMRLIREESNRALPSDMSP